MAKHFRKGGGYFWPLHDSDGARNGCRLRATVSTGEWWLAGKYKRDDLQRESDPSSVVGTRKSVAAGYGWLNERAVRTW